MARQFAPVSLSKGSFLFYRNDESQGIYFVTKGSFQIIIDNEESKEIIVYTIGDGDILGEMSLFTNMNRSATAVALAPSKLYKISNTKFIEMMKRYPDIAINLTQILVERLLSANETIERLGAMDGKQRVAHFLRALIMREGSEDGKKMVLKSRPTYYQISQRLGISEKTVYRTISSLAKDGIIDIKGRGLVVDRSFLNTEQH